MYTVWIGVCIVCTSIAYTHLYTGCVHTCVLMDIEFKVLVSRFSTHPPTGDRVCRGSLAYARGLVIYIYIYV